MANGYTNRGKYNMLDLQRGQTLVTNFYLALVTNDNVPNADTNTMSDLTEIAAGNGYTSGGFQLTPNGTDFDSLTEDDANDRADMQIKDVAWTASGGSIPGSGNAIRYAVLTDDNATVADREVWAFFDLSSDRTVANGQTLTLADCGLRAS